jgi:hypothetical protein
MPADLLMFRVHQTHLVRPPSRIAPIGSLCSLVRVRPIVLSPHTRNPHKQAHLVPFALTESLVRRSSEVGSRP